MRSTKGWPAVTALLSCRLEEPEAAAAFLVDGGLMRSYRARKVGGEHQRVTLLTFACCRAFSATGRAAAATAILENPRHEMPAL